MLRFDTFGKSSGESVLIRLKNLRVKFEEKLKKEVAEVGLEFEESYRRAGITLLELVFAMATALNMDDSELTDVLLRTRY